MRVARFVLANAHGMMWRPNDVLSEQDNLKAADSYLPPKKNSAADAASLFFCSPAAGGDQGVYCDARFGKHRGL
jgi:hypothetical protein